MSPVSRLYVHTGKRPVGRLIHFAVDVFSNVRTAFSGKENMKPLVLNTILQMKNNVSSVEEKSISR